MRIAGFRKIDRIVIADNEITIEELTAACGWSDNWMKRNHALLKQQGLIRRVRPDKGRHWEVIEK